MQEPSFNQRRPRFGCVAGTFSPSHRHRRSLVVDLPAGVTQQGGDPPIAVTTVLAGQFDHVRDQAVLVGMATRGTRLGRAMLTQHPAGMALRGPEPVTNMVDALATTRGARKFHRAASFRICLSSV